MDHVADMNKTFTVESLAHFMDTLSICAKEISRKLLNGEIDGMASGKNKVYDPGFDGEIF